MRRRGLKKGPHAPEILDSAQGFNKVNITIKKPCVDVLAKKAMTNSLSKTVARAKGA